MKKSDTPIARAGYVFLFYLMLLWLGVMLLIGNIAVLPLAFAPAKFREPFIQQAISAILRFFLWGVESVGLMHFELAELDALNQERGMLLIANHPSMIDIFLVLSRVRRGVCIMKSSIGTNIFLGVGARLAGYISNAHTGLMFRKAIDSVERGNLLIAFPEGTRTTRQPVNKIKSAVGFIAKRAGAPLQTIILTSNSAYLSKGWKIWRPPQFPIVYSARLGLRFFALENHIETALQLQAHFESELALADGDRQCVSIAK